MGLLFMNAKKLVHFAIIIAALLLLQRLFESQTTIDSNVTSIKTSEKLTDDRVTERKPDLLWFIDNTEENENVLTDALTSISVDSENLLLKKLQQLDKYNIVFQRASILRIEHVLKASENTCIANRILTPERQQYSVYTSPQSLYLTVRLYQLKNGVQIPEYVFDSEGSISSLPALFDALPNTKVAIGEGVSYGRLIDQQIAQLDENNTYRRTGNYRIKLLGKMFLNNRVEFLIYYPSEIQMFTDDESELISYRLGNANKFVLGRVTCSKGEFGEQVIEDINQVLKSLYPSTEFYKTHFDWVNENHGLEYLRHFNEVYRPK